jgi:hypothetical protein
MKKRIARILHIATLVLMGLTAAMTLLSAVGTTCVAWGAEKYASMAALVPYKPLYQIIVVVTFVVGLAAVAATAGLIRRTPWAYRATIATLAAGILVSGVHVYASAALRGSAAPANVRFYLSILTLIAALLMHLPGLWELIRSDERDPCSDASTPASGLVAVTSGLAIVTAPLWAGPTHLLDGVQWANVLATPLTALGAALCIFSATTLLAAHLKEGDVCQAVSLMTHQEKRL